jgi:hypothetical protein
MLFGAGVWLDGSAAGAAAAGAIDRIPLNPELAAGLGPER